MVPLRRRRSRRLLLVGTLLALLLGLAACGASGTREDDDRLRVVCTIGMITDLAQRVAGSRAKVEGLLGPGIDPHLYKPTRTDVGRLLEADLVFLNGFHLEGRMAEALSRAEAAGRRVIAVAEELPQALQLRAGEGSASAVDPHLWMDPRAWKEVVGVIADALSAADPEGAEGYAARARALRERLEALDRWAEAALATVPPERRVLVTAHDAFNYFGRRYGYEVRGIQGLSTESEAGVRDLEDLVDLLVRRGVPAVFAETTVSDRNVRALVRGARARGREVVLGGALYSDAMGPAGRYEGTYVGMIDRNVTNVVRALGGEVAPGGFEGRLSE